MFYLRTTLAILAVSDLIAGAALGSNQLARDISEPQLFHRQNKKGASKTCLAANALQTSSEKTGQEAGTDGIKAGQAPSATDDSNFINFCSGQKITNGVQITTGSCNGIPMGKIPASKNMISAMIASPQIGEKIPADTTFNISVQTAHLDAGFFVNPTTNYYTAPQDLNDAGDIIGHCHVTVQSIGSLKSTTPPDPTTFAFFKGIDDAGNGKGLLSAIVTDGLPAGAYRVCTMIAARNHQPVNMPVAQRGAQDDCQKFEVVAAGGGGGGGKAGGKGKDNAGSANEGKMATGKVDGKAKDDGAAAANPAKPAKAATSSVAVKASAAPAAETKKAAANAGGGKAKDDGAAAANPAKPAKAATSSVAVKASAAPAAETKKAAANTGGGNGRNRGAGNGSGRGSGQRGRGGRSR